MVTMTYVVFYELYGQQIYYYYYYYCDHGDDDDDCDFISDNDLYCDQYYAYFNDVYDVDDVYVHVICQNNSYVCRTDHELLIYDSIHQRYRHYR